MREAEESSMIRKVNEIAEMVGQERFYLTVGGLLHKIGATVGLIPDGIASRSDAERINAPKIFEEKVQEAEHYERNIFNPSISEFCSMMHEIDSFQSVLAKIIFTFLQIGNRRAEFRG